MFFPMVLVVTQFFSGHTRPVISAAISLDGSAVISADDLGEIRCNGVLFLPGIGRPGHVYYTHQKGVAINSRVTALGSEGRVLIAIGALAKRGAVKVVGGPVIADDLPGYVVAIAVSRGGIIAIGCTGGIVLVDDGKKRNLDVEYKGSFNSLAFAGETLILIEKNGVVSSWDVATHKRIRDYDIGAQSVAVSPNSNLLAVGTILEGNRPIVVVWRIETAELEASWSDVGEAPIYCVAFGPDNKTVVAGSRCGKVSVLR